MKQNQSKFQVPSRAIPSGDQIKRNLENLMAKMSLGQHGKVIVIEKGTIILTPEVRAGLVKPVTEKIPLLGKAIQHEILTLKKLADAGDDVALQILYEVAMFGVLALNSAHNNEAVKLIAQHKSVWPIMGSSDDSIIKHNEEIFTRIGLGSKMTTRPISDLLRYDSDELLWAVTIQTEINRMRDFVRVLDPDKKTELFAKTTLWPFNIRTRVALLKADVILECGNLPPLDSDEKTKKLWWVVLEKIFEIVTNNKWEEVPELRKTHERAAKTNSSNSAYIRNYIRSNIKKNLKNKFFTRVTPSQTSQPAASK